MSSAHDQRFALHPDLGSACGEALETHGKLLLVRLTVLGADLLVRWRSGSIGHDGALVVGTPLLDLVHPDDRAELVRSFRQTRQEPGHGRRVMLRLRNGDAGHRYFEVAVANRLQDPSLRGYVVTMRDISDREDIERERQAMSGKRLRDEAARAQVERLRERLDAQRERQELEQMLQRARRLESVGQLAGGVAHDFNNLLAAILGDTTAWCATTARETSPLQEETRGDRTSRAMARASTPAAVAFSRQPGERVGRAQPQRGQSSEQPRAAEAGRMGEGFTCTLAIDLEPGLWTIKADRRNLEQVIVNLLVNARDAIRGAARSSCDRHRRPAHRAGRRPPHAGGSLRPAERRRHGPGIDEWTLADELDPFFTTKDPGKGTGLGLATVLGIASQAGGTVTIDSRPGDGTAVHVYLPASSPLVPLDMRHAAPAGSTRLS